MKLFFILSGEHETLPGAEVRAVLETAGADFRVTGSMEQVLLVEADDIGYAHRRLALSHAVCEHIFSCGPGLDEVLRSARRAEYPALEDFAVRVRRVREHHRELSTLELEREIGAVIVEKTGARVKLEEPRQVVQGVITDGGFVLGRVLSRVDRSPYEARRPHLRPYFRPGAILPRTARAIVNLAGVSPGKRVMDPFCGTGGFLIEAGLLGAEVYGNDIEEEFVEGCRRNLEFYGVRGFTLETGDATALPERYPGFFDAVVTDPPYGIQASTRGKQLDQVFVDALKAIYGMLKPGGRACVISPTRVEFDAAAENAGFRIRETHYERIHRSLTRRISVLEK
ncbi:MAG: TIGR01177 family methyltransferase [Euryarchaeota archaeon]|nr:TIGR01177 family methyltransferase [Euryarchaeota archaeon]